MWKATEVSTQYPVPSTREKAKAQSLIEDLGKSGWGIKKKSQPRKNRQLYLGTT